ncbi:AraC family transcriptional regulator [Parahaliea aestuarii]|uniref:AraC family transcriptional regulator n=1 Tax=Parahaliea aestuarii TaxID=1852021 RepID=A0A5C9A1L1_9GAMM|nr:AraC family transcriptional regulator [Parahaliea aestuarii]TXS94648.1 AraC family transcriptional regulator [Parahaliea aestuarii]
MKSGITAQQRELIPAGFIEALLAQGERAGRERELLLGDAAFPFDPLRGCSATQTTSSAAFSRLALALFRVLDDEAGGSMPDAPTPVGTARLLAFSLLGSHNLGAALRRAIEFNRCCRLNRGQSAVNSLTIDEDLREATLSYYLEGSDRAQQRLLCGLAIWMRFCGWLIGQHIDVVSARCAAAAPANVRELRHFFPCPVAFGAADNAVVFSVRHLEAELLRSETDLSRYLREAPYCLVVAPKPSSLSITRRIRELLGDDFRCEMPSFEDLTGMLNMSARTLRRRLEREGTSYQRIKDNARRDLAIALLQRDGATVSEVAERVGFSDPSAFHRSFKKWTGESPGAFRA